MSGMSRMLEGEITYYKEKVKALEQERDGLAEQVKQLTKEVDDCRAGKALALQDLRSARKLSDLLAERVKKLEHALKSCAPSWLPSAIRDLRREALAQDDEMAKS